MDCNFDVALSVTAKVLCISVLVLQSVLLDYIIVNADSGASTACRYGWIGADVVVILFWVASMVFSHRFFNPPAPRKKAPADAEGQSCSAFLKPALKELPLAYVSWLLYAVVLIAKINHMFGTFAEKLTSVDETLLSNTSLKILLSLAGVLFALLAYAHHDEAHNTRYKLLMEKLGVAASIDLLDVVMLLDILFVAANRVEVTFAMDRAVRVFASICIILPVVPLLTMRLIAASGGEGGTARAQRSYPLVLVLNSALFIFLVNVPLLVIRLVLWFHHDVDVTTFLTKNIMAIAMGSVDIYKNLVSWQRDLAQNPDGDVVQMEAVSTTD